MKFSEKLYRKASQKYREGDYEGALEDIENCLNSLRKTAIHSRNRDSEDFKRYVDAKILQGEIYNTLDLDGEVQELIESLQSLSIGSGDDTGYIKARINYFGFEIANKKGDNEEALNHLIRAKDGFIDAGFYQEAIEILFDLENYPEYSIDSEKLMELYKEILDLNKNIDDKNAKKINSGRSRLQIAKVLRRSNEKKSRKSLVVAYNELFESKSLYLESLYYLAEMYMREHPGKTNEVLDKIKQDTESDYHKVRTDLLEATISLIQSDGQVDWNSIIQNLQNINIDLSLADNLIDTVRYIIIYGKEENHSDALALINMARQVYDEQNDRIGKSMSYLYEGLACDISEADNKLNLVEIYTKSIKEEKVPYLRTMSLDLIHWVNTSVEADEIRDEVKDQYNKDKLLMAETLALIGLYHKRKKSIESHEFLEEATNLYNSTKLKKHQNLEKFKSEIPA